MRGILSCISANPLPSFAPPSTHLPTHYLSAGYSQRTDVYTVFILVNRVCQNGQSRIANHYRKILQDIRDNVKIRWFDKINLSELLRSPFSPHPRLSYTPLIISSIIFLPSFQVHKCIRYAYHARSYIYTLTIVYATLVDKFAIS